MKYSIIYADPPWQYRNKKTGASMTSGADAKYPTMPLADICALPVKSEIAMPDSALFLWVTTPLKWEGLEVMKAWGFTYETTVYWRKIMSLGMGFWFRGQVEELLVGVRGNLKAFHLQEPNFIQTKVLAHSEKPKEFREMIERATAKMPVQTRLEMFARCQPEGWDVFGNQVEQSIVLPVSNI